MAPPLITVAQLASRLQTAVDTASAQLAVDNASGLVRAISRQDITFVADDTVTLTGGRRVLTLPQRPVSDLHPVTVVEGSYFGSVAVALVEGRDYERTGSELTRGWPWWWGSADRFMGWPYNRPLGVWAPRVTVTYSHGYDPVPDDVVSLVLDVAQAMYTNPSGVRSMSIDDYSVQYATELLGAPTVEAITAKLAATGRRGTAFSIST